MPSTLNHKPTAHRAPRIKQERVEIDRTIEDDYNKSVQPNDPSPRGSSKEVPRHRKRSHGSSEQSSNLQAPTSEKPEKKYTHIVGKRSLPNRKNEGTVFACQLIAWQVLCMLDPEPMTYVPWAAGDFKEAERLSLVLRVFTEMGGFVSPLGRAT